MVAKPTWRCIQNHPESQCSYGHWSLQTQRCNDGWHCPQGHDGGLIDALLTSHVFENPRLKSSRNLTNFGRGSFLYSCSSFVDPFHFVSFCWRLFCFSDDSNCTNGPVCSFTSTSQFQTPGLAERHSDAEYFLLHVVGRPKSRPPLFQTQLKRCMCVSAILPTSNQSFMWVPLLLLFWTVSTLAIGNFCKCNKTNSCWPKLPYGSGADLTISGCGLFSRSTPINPTFGLWNKP